MRLCTVTHTYIPSPHAHTHTYSPTFAASVVYMRKKSRLYLQTVRVALCEVEMCVSRASLGE